MPLTLEEVRHIATLARIRMSDTEAESMLGQLSTILQQFEELKQLDTKDIPVTAHSSDVDTVMRDDKVSNSCKKEQLLSNVPDREGDFIKVKAVLE